MIARYRRMPRGRPAMPCWCLAKTQLIATQILGCRALDFPATTTALFANLQQILGCAATTELLRTCERFWIAQRQPNYCKPAKDFGLPAPRQVCYCEQSKPNFATTFMLPNYQTAASLLLGWQRLIRNETRLSLSRIWLVPTINSADTRPENQ